MTSDVEQPQVQPPPVDTSENQLANFSSPTVLLVDDDPSTRRYLAHLLTHEGYQVVQAEDGEQALALYFQMQPQIVLLDA
ncbi:MAG: response regulator, partial [Thermostichus sp. DG_1_5_bins_95]